MLHGFELLPIADDAQADINRQRPTNHDVMVRDAMVSVRRLERYLSAATPQDTIRIAQNETQLAERDSDAPLNLWTTKTTTERAEVAEEEEQANNQPADLSPESNKANKASKESATADKESAKPSKESAQTTKQDSQGAKKTEKQTGQVAQIPAAPRGDDLLLRGEDAEADKAKKPGESSSEPSGDGTASASEEHLALFVEDRYPAAATCATCHPKHYKEWSVSQHAYAQLSPIYLSLNNKINELSNGSNGDFCLRCHNPVGANLGESSFASNLERHPTSREGITCIACHRINMTYNKVSGRLALVEGGLTDPVFGPEGNQGVEEVLEQPEKFRVETNPEKPGRKIHNEAKVFDPIKSSTFCGSCHDVTLFNGFRLEEAFSEYRVSPAAAKGITCQDCHMGKIQGKVSGYDEGPAAVVGDVPTKTQKAHKPPVLRPRLSGDPSRHLPAQ